jgi:uncharacterized repeat protein (TIGR03803 family)
MNQIERRDFSTGVAARRPKSTLLVALVELTVLVALLSASAAFCQSDGAMHDETPSAPKFATVITFSSTNGSDPESPLVQGRDGNLYGTTFKGGAYSYQGTCSSGCGTVFKLTTAGALTTLYNFCANQNGLDACNDGWGPWGLTLGTDGNFYDMTFSGGSATAVSIGTIFKITALGSRTQLFALKEFGGCKQNVQCFGVYPLAGLVEASDKNFYGTTVDGGTGGGGVMLKVNPLAPPPPTVLYNFTSPSNSPGATPIQGSDGDLYGTTYDVDLFQQFTGSVYRLSLTGEFTTLYNFCSLTNCADGSRPYSPVIQGADGNLYGTTSTGGLSATGEGTVFKLTPAGVLTTLHGFGSQSPDGANPVGGLVQGTDGNLYGVTPNGGSSCGVVFKITTSGTFTILHSFDFTDGCLPHAGLVQATNGLFYGTTTVDGNSNNCSGGGCGTVFSLDVGLKPFVAFVLPAGAVGDTAEMLGQGFTGTTGVTFNGLPASSFHVVSDTYLTAVVPAGAGTGPVVVTTQTGTLKSNKNFRITP